MRHPVSVSENLRGLNNLNKNEKITGLNELNSLLGLKYQKLLALYILSDFSGIRNLNDLNNLSGLNDLNSLNSSKNILSLMFLSTLAPKWPIMVSQFWMDHQKSSILNQILPSFRTEAVEDRDVNSNQIEGSILKCPLPMNIQIHFMLHILISKTL